MREQVVRAGEQLSRAHVRRGVLRIVEDLEVVDLRPPLGAAVAVPLLRGLRALDAVAAHEDRQTEVAPQKAPHGARRFRLADDVLDKPVLIEYVARLVVYRAGVRLDELDRPLVDLLGDDAGEQQIAVLAEVDDAELVEAWGTVVDA